MKTKIQLNKILLIALLTVLVFVNFGSVARAQNDAVSAVAGAGQAGMEAGAQYTAKVIACGQDKECIENLINGEIDCSKLSGDDKKKCEDAKKSFLSTLWDVTKRQAGCAALAVIPVVGPVGTGICSGINVVMGITGKSVTGAVRTILETPYRIAITIVNYILEAIIWLIGFLVSKLIAIAIGVFQYNNFVDADIVSKGWNIIRDLTNMVFVMMFLVMAFYTVLGKSEYGASKFLVRLIIAAVLINFSRTIVGVIIDFSQVVMLTFVNGFQAVAAGNIINAFHLDQLMKPGSASDSNMSDQLTHLATLIVGVVLGSVMLFTVLAMVIMLTMRIIALWLLIIVSPVAFTIGLLPKNVSVGGIAKAADQWWSKLINYCAAGPVLAFFLWLTLYYTNTLSSSIGDFKIAEATGDTTPFSEITKAENLFGTILATTMLLFGVKLAAGMNVVGADFAQKAVNFSKKQATRAGKALGAYATRGAGQLTAGTRLRMGNFMTKMPGLRGAGASVIRSTQKGIQERQARGAQKLEGLTFEQKKRFEEHALTPEGKTAARMSQMNDFFGMRRYLTAAEMPEGTEEEKAAKRKVQNSRVEEWRGKLKEENAAAKARNDGATLGKIVALKRDNPMLYNLEKKDGKYVDPGERDAFEATVGRATFADLEKIDPTQLTQDHIEAMGEAGRGNIMNRGSEALKAKIREFNAKLPARAAADLVPQLQSGDLEAKSLHVQDFTGKFADGKDNDGSLSRELIKPENAEIRKSVEKDPALRAAFVQGLQMAYDPARAGEKEMKQIAEARVILGGSAELKSVYEVEDSGTFKNTAAAGRFGEAMSGDNGVKMFLNITDVINQNGAGSVVAGIAAQGLGKTDLKELATTKGLSRAQRDSIGILLERIMQDGVKAKPGSDAYDKAQYILSNKIFEEYRKAITPPSSGTPAGGGGGGSSAGGGAGGTTGGGASARPTATEAVDNDTQRLRALLASVQAAPEVIERGIKYYQNVSESPEHGEVLSRSIGRDFQNSDVLVNVKYEDGTKMEYRASNRYVNAEMSDGHRMGWREEDEERLRAEARAAPLVKPEMPVELLADRAIKQRLADAEKEIKTREAGLAVGGIAGTMREQIEKGIAEIKDRLESYQKELVRRQELEEVRDQRSKLGKDYRRLDQNLALGVPEAIRTGILADQARLKARMGGADIKLREADELDAQKRSQYDVKLRIYNRRRKEGK